MRVSEDQLFGASAPVKRRGRREASCAVDSPEGDIATMIADRHAATAWQAVRNASRIRVS